MHTEIEYVTIEEIEYIGEDDTYDIWNHDPRCQDIEGGNFVIDNIITHNSIPEAMQNRDDISENWKHRLKNIHPELYEILKDTYGIILYQEQLAAIWQRLAGFTSPEAQEARKAVAKKWTHKLKDIGKKWIDGATPNIGKDNAEQLWAAMVSFGRYAFNKCLDKSTLITCQKTGQTKTVEEWFMSDIKPHINSFDGNEVIVDECVDIHYTGEQEVFEVTFDNGQTERITINHKFLCEDGEYHELREIIDQRLEVTEAQVGITCPT
jgi:hypothetical protein